MIKTIFFKPKINNQKHSIFRGGLVSIIIKVIGLVLSLMTAIVLARVLGPKQFGVYSYVLAIVSILAVPAMFGLPSLIVRETAKAELKKEWGKIRGLWSWANRVTAILSLTIALLTIILLLVNRDSFTQMQFLTFAWGIVFIPLSALAALRGASLRGLRKVIQGQLPEQILKPALFVFMLAVVGFSGSSQLTAKNAMMLNAISTGMAFAIGVWLLFKGKPKQIGNARREFEKKAWTVSIIPFAVLSGLAVIVTQTDIVMLGILKSSTDVGIYKVATQGAALAGLGIVAVNMVTMPYMSRFSISNNIGGIARLAQKSARVSFLIALVVTSVFGLFGGKIITMVFGASYISSYWPLLLLAIGQVFHSGLGPGGTILNMCGHENGTLITLILSALLNIILNFLFIPVWGFNGAAAATLISIVFRKVIIWIVVYFTFRIDSSAFGLTFGK